MKSSGTCPKCGGKDIIVVPGWTGAYGAGNNIPVGLTIIGAAKVDRYLCARCGFSEEWVDMEKMDRIREKYSE